MDYFILAREVRDGSLARRVVLRLGFPLLAFGLGAGLRDCFAATLISDFCFLGWDLFPDRN